MILPLREDLADPQGEQYTRAERVEKPLQSRGFAGNVDRRDFICMPVGLGLELPPPSRAARACACKHCRERSFAEVASIANTCLFAGADARCRAGQGCPIAAVALQGRKRADACDRAGLSPRGGTLGRACAMRARGVSCSRSSRRRVVRHQGPSSDFLSRACPDEFPFSALVPQ